MTEAEMNALTTELAIATREYLGQCLEPLALKIASMEATILELQELLTRPK